MKRSLLILFSSIVLQLNAHEIMYHQVSAEHIHYGHNNNQHNVAMCTFLPDSLTSISFMQSIRYGKPPEEQLSYPARLIEIIDNKFALERHIRAIIEEKNSTVGVAVIYDGKDTLAVNNDQRYPMQSVFKFHLALAVADHLNKNQLPLNSEIYIKQNDLLPNTYSPLRDRFPKGEFYMSIPELLKYSVSLSDNNAADILFRFAGGTTGVEHYIRTLGINDISIVATEAEMHESNDLQYDNWTTPLEAVRLMEIYLNKALFPEPHRKLIEDALIQTATGPDKLKGLLPEGTVVGHKTGSGFRDASGRMSADNDLGFVILPNGKKYSIAVFIKDSMESDKENAATIAAISKLVYDYYCQLTE